MRLVNLASTMAVFAVILLPIGCKGGDAGTSPPLDSSPPVAFAMADSYYVDPGESVCFFDYSPTPDGGASRSYDPDGTIKKWEWDFSYEVSAGFITESVVMHPCVEFDRTGRYQVQLRVTDNSDNTDMLDNPLVVNVGLGSAPPVAKAIAEPLMASPDQQVHFRDDGSYDPDGGSIVKYEWDWDNDGTFDEEGSETYHEWTTPGTHSIQFRVTDDEGQSDTLDAPLAITVISGELMWARSAGGVDDDGGRGITVLSDDSIVVTGWFFESATFRVGEPNETTLTSDGLDDIFIARYNPDGNLAWARHAGGTSLDWGYRITALSDDSTVVTGLFGLFWWPATFGEGEPNETTLDRAAYWGDIFIARYNADGSFAWVTCPRGSGFKGSGGITALSDDSTVLTGYYDGSLTFGEDEPNETGLASDGEFDIYIARYNPDGSLAWARRAGGTGDDEGSGIVTLPDNSIIVTGSYERSATFGMSEPNQTTLTSDDEYNIFIARYNPDGSLAWARHAGGSDYNNGIGDVALSHGSIVVTGSFRDSATFGDGQPNETTLDSHGHWDIFIARYNPDGSLAWVRRAGGTESDVGYGIVGLSDDSTVVTGYYLGAATFGDGEPNETTLHSHGQEDIFIARYNPDGSLAWLMGPGGTNTDTGYGIAALSDNSLILTGLFMDSATFGVGEPNETTLTSDGEHDIFIARYYP